MPPLAIIVVLEVFRHAILAEHDRLEVLLDRVAMHFARTESELVARLSKRLLHVDRME